MYFASVKKMHRFFAAKNAAQDDNWLTMAIGSGRSV
jgi:hypothetical protein